MPEVLSHGRESTLAEQYIQLFLFIALAACSILQLPAESTAARTLVEGAAVSDTSQNRLQYVLFVLANLNEQTEVSTSLLNQQA